MEQPILQIEPIWQSLSRQPIWMVSRRTTLDSCHRQRCQSELLFPQCTSPLLLIMQRQPHEMQNLFHEQEFRVHLQIFSSSLLHVLAALVSDLAFPHSFGPLFSSFVVFLSVRCFAKL